LKAERRIIILSALSGLLVWAVAALVDSWLLEEGSYYEHLISDVAPREIYYRLIVILSFLSSGWLISRIVAKLRRAEDRTEHLNVTLRAIRKVNQLITVERDRDGLIQGVCEKLVTKRGYKSAWVALTSASGELVSTGEAGLHGAFLQLREGLSRGQLPPCGTKAMSSQRVIVNRSGSPACAGCPLAREYLKTGGALTIRLECGEKIYGLISVSPPPDLVVDKEEHSLLREVAGDIAFALNSIELEDKRKQAENLQGVLYEIANAVHTAEDLGQLFRVMQRQLGTVLSTENFFIALYDKETDTLTLPYTVDEHDRYKTFPAGKSLTAYVIRSNTPLLATREQVDRMVGAGIVEMIGTPSKVWLGAPLRAGEDVIGALVVQSYTDEQRFGERDLEMLTFVSGQIGLAVERKRAEERVRSQREELQVILDSVPAYISYKDKEGRHIRVNRALAEATGIPQGRWVGRTTLDLFPETPEECRDNDAEVIATGQPKTNIVEPLETPAGTRWALTDKIPYRDKDGNVVGVIGLSVDTTERMKAEEALQRKEEELRQAQKMEAIGRLAGGIAHDFNNLLTAMSGYTELMLGEVGEDDPMHADLVAVKKAAGQAASLTRQLLAFSRRQPLQLAVADLNLLVDGTKEILRRLIGEDISVVTELDPELSRVNVDHSQIEQVILNLAVNARDAMPEGGSISVRTENVEIDEHQAELNPDARAGRFVCLSVQDTGVGMDRETMEQIFEPFFTTKGPAGGTGLGLSVVYGNIKQHEGWIHVYSEPGRGSTFRIYLPSSSDEAEEEVAVDKASDAVPEGAGERILLVEDEEVVRRFAVRALQQRGYDVLEAGTAEEAFEMFEKESGDFELVFSDVVLPGKSGVQLVDELLARKPALTILLASGYADQKSQWPVIRERGFRFLQKPYSVNDLLMTIRDVLH
jgi:PAS domain S-box-containing protein